MAAVSMGTLTLSAIEGWDTEHLESAARSWDATAQHWEDTFTAVHRGSLNPGGTVWEGEGADAAQQRTFVDLVKVRGMSDHLHEAAKIARRGADQLDHHKRAAVNAIDAARAAGFNVGEDLSLSDRSLTPLGPALAARQAQAQTLAAEIRLRAAALSAADHEIAANITTATAPLSGIAFDEEPATSGGHPPPDEKKIVQAVDYKEAPGQPDSVGSDVEQTTVPPLRPGEPIDPKNWRIGDPRFGYWEDVKVPHKPWSGDSPPPLTSENRPFPEDIRNNLAAGPSNFFVPNRSWGFDNEGPYAQLQEQYKIRISGTEATPYTRVIDTAAGSTQERWVQYNYDVAHVRQMVLGGDVKVKGMAEPGDIAGLGPFRWQSDDWTPWSFNDIAQLSANNPDTKFYIPDGCGGQFTYQGAVPVGPPPVGVSAPLPIITGSS